MSLALATRGYIAPAGSGGPLPPDDEEDEEELVPIPSPYEPGDPEYVDHVAEALNRLPHYLARVP